MERTPTILGMTIAICACVFLSIAVCAVGGCTAKCLRVHVGNPRAQHDALQVETSRRLHRPAAGHDGKDARIGGANPSAEHPLPAVRAASRFGVSPESRDESPETLSTKHRTPLMTLQELLNQRAGLVAKARALIDGAEKAGRDMTAEEAAEFDKIDGEIADLTKQIDQKNKDREAQAARVQRLEAHETALQALNTHGVNRQTTVGSAAGQMPGGRSLGFAAASDEDRALAIQGWFLMQSGVEDVSAEHEEAAQRCGINLTGRFLTLDLHSDYGQVRSALRSNVPSEGGVLRLGEFAGPLEQAMLAFGPMLDVAQVIRTPHANPFPWPHANDTQNTGRQIGEAKAVNSGVDPTFGAMVLAAYKFTSDEILVPYELMRDARGVNLTGILSGMLGERLGRVLNTKFTIGSGAGTAFGIVPRSTLGKETAGATAITADELIDLQHSVPRAYRKGAGFMAADAVWKAIRKLKGEDNQYIWQPGLVAGQPDTLLTWPTSVNDDMDDTLEAGAKSMLAGNFTSYKVRQVNRVRLYRLTERHRENDQDAFLAFVEADGNLLDPGTGPVRHLLQKAT